MNSRAATVFLILLATVSTLQLRAKRQFGQGWGAPGWQQSNWNSQNNQANAQQSKYNCQTESIDILGLPISEYDCTSSAQSARASVSQQSQQQQQSFGNGPIGTLIRDLEG